MSPLMPLTPLNALSPLDGRYRAKVAALAEFFSEFALIRYRVRVEVRWLMALAAEPAVPEVPAFSPAALPAPGGRCVASSTKPMRRP